MTGSTRSLPEYSKPPVIETVLGVEFAPIPGFGLLEIGLLHDEWRDRFPRYQILPPLPSLLEGSSGAGISEAGSFVARLSSSPEFRVWMISQEGTRLAQVQGTRLLLNWRAMPGAADYPRYERLLEDFQTLWYELVDFLEEHGLGEPQLMAFEVTYVNHFVKHREYASAADLGKIFPFWKFERSEFLPDPIAGGFRLVFPVATGATLEVKLDPAVRHTDLREILQLELSVRGATMARDFKELRACLDTGHDWIVRGFTELTSDDLHVLWERSR